MKRCPMCKDELDESFFHKNNSRKDGLSSYCKECNIKAQKKQHLKSGQIYLQILGGDRFSLESLARIRRSKKQNRIKKYGEAVAEILDGQE